MYKSNNANQAPTVWVKDTQVNGTRLAISEKGSVKIGKSNLMPSDVAFILAHITTIRELCQEAVGIREQYSTVAEAQKFQAKLASEAQKFAGMGKGYLQAMREQLERLEKEQGE